MVQNLPGKNVAKEFCSDSGSRLLRLDMQCVRGLPTPNNMHKCFLFFRKCFNVHDICWSLLTMVLETLAYGWNCQVKHTGITAGHNLCRSVNIFPISNKVKIMYCYIVHLRAMSVFLNLFKSFGLPAYYQLGCILLSSPLDLLTKKSPKLIDPSDNNRW